MKKFCKVLVIVLCAAMLVAGSIAGTFAYLSMKTDSVMNTFTVGNINITLTQESTISGNMVPGVEYTVNPVVTVTEGSEACWLFIKIDTNDTDEFLTYEMDTGWTKLDNVDGVYYREVSTLDQDQNFGVIKDGTVTAVSNKTKGDYENIAGSLTLSFTAYAVQKVGFDNAATAWAEAATLSQ